MTDSYTIKAYPGWSLPEGYRGFVFAKWLRSLRYGNDYFKLVKPESFYHNYKTYIERILGQREALIRFAVLSDDHDVILGFSCARNKILDYVYVQNTVRKQGIAAKLTPTNIDTITHLTRTALSIWGSTHPEWKFDPFA